MLFNVKMKGRVDLCLVKNTGYFAARNGIAFTPNQRTITAGGCLSASEAAPTSRNNSSSG